MIAKKYYCELYKTTYHFYIGCSAKIFEKTMSKQLDENISVQGLDGLTVTFAGGNEIAVWIRKKNDYASLAHEMLHATNATLKSIGWRMSLDNDEPQTYLLELLIEKALKP